MDHSFFQANDDIREYELWVATAAGPGKHSFCYSNRREQRIFQSSPSLCPSEVICLLLWLQNQVLQSTRLSKTGVVHLSFHLVAWNSHWCRKRWETVSHWSGCLFVLQLSFQEVYHQPIWTGKR